VTERVSEVGRLIRLGFTEPGVAVESLTAARLWVDGGPADAEAGAVVIALGETPDPDLAAATLARLVEAVRHPQELLDGLREREGLRSRLLSVLGTSTVLGDHLVTHPDDWYVLADDEVTTVRPSLFGLQRQLLDAVGASTRTRCRGAPAVPSPRAPTSCRRCARRTGVVCLPWQRATCPARWR
jgi:glutamate-ammonia-ligase adenylyltransferase